MRNRPCGAISALVGFCGIIGSNLVSVVVSAQTGGYGGFIHTLPYAGGTLGAGATNVVTACGYSSLSSNPAAVGLAESAAGGFGIVVFPDGTKLQYVGINSRPQRASIAVGLSEFYAGGIPAYDDKGDKIGTLNYVSTSLHSAVSVRALSRVMIGIGSTLHVEHIEGIPRGVVFGSVGVMIRANHWSTVAASLLETVYVSSPGAAPPEYWFGTFGLRIDIASFAVASVASYSGLGGANVAGGLELRPSSLWSVRLGWRQDGPTWGVGFDLGGLRVSVDNAVVDQLALTVAEISIRL